MSLTFLIIAAIAIGIAVAMVAKPLFGTNSKATVAALAVGIPLVSLGLYSFLGSPGMSAVHPTTDQTAASTAGSNDDKTIGSVASMLDGLETRLKEDPDDADSWLLLAKSHEYLGQINDAKAAYAKAKELGQLDADLAAKLDNKVSVANTSTSIATVSGYLQLSERAMKIVQPTDTVFIFARPVGEAGVPIAVLKRSAAELPINFVLDDSLAMMADNKLSDHDEVVVTARISRTGDAPELLQNLESKSGATAVASDTKLQMIIQ